MYLEQTRVRKEQQTETAAAAAAAAAAEARCLTGGPCVRTVLLLLVLFIDYSFIFCIYSLFVVYTSKRNKDLYRQSCLYTRRRLCAICPLD